MKKIGLIIAMDKEMDIFAATLQNLLPQKFINVIFIAELSATNKLQQLFQVWVTLMLLCARLI